HPGVAVEAFLVGMIAIGADGMATDQGIVLGNRQNEAAACGPAVGAVGFAAAPAGHAVIAADSWHLAALDGLVPVVSQAQVIAEVNLLGFHIDLLLELVARVERRGGALFNLGSQCLALQRLELAIGVEIDRADHFQRQDLGPALGPLLRFKIGEEKYVGVLGDALVAGVLGRQTENGLGKGQVVPLRTAKHANGYRVAVMRRVIKPKSSLLDLANLLAITQIKAKQQMLRIGTDAQGFLATHGLVG